MKTLVITLFLAAICCLAQSAPASNDSAAVSNEPLPTYVGVGAAFNQIGQPRFNLWAAAVYPVSSRAGVYMSTTTDIIPISQIDPVTKRQFWAFQTSIRQGAHKIVFSSGKFTALAGGDAGAGVSQASPSGINVSFAGSLTITAVYDLGKKFALVVPVRALWTGQSSWNVLPEIGILFKP